MKKLSIILIISGSVTFCRAQSYVANMDGSQEVPPNNTSTGLPASSYADFSLTGSTLSCTYGLYFIAGYPASVTMNDGTSGTTGPVLFELTLGTMSTLGGYADGFFEGAGILTAQQIIDLNDGNLYVNVDSYGYPDGQIRGQLEPAPEPGTLALVGLGAVVLVAGRGAKKGCGMRGGGKMGSGTPARALMNLLGRTRGYR